ncbi:MAG TPA: class I adenylate-forming enzyme family protein [Nocardioides sp.]|uniref:class I adenylate-forming enzyme family protein n=1 Tax=Nocardioides sp. TaxID=35761 RepID=UPI002B8467A1|nr:class I adenylate-forming enzyme family protein [Nocardioides sp.]HTW16803.1 class I adenylate-forming enzyme family protein [Nocardioides sp.]
MTTRDEAVARLTAPGRPFEIRVEDVRGQQLQVFAHRQRSLGRLLADSARHGDGEYLVTERSRLTFAEHLDAVAALAAALRTEYGVGRGDRVAICAANCPEWIVTFWAAQALGAVVVGMNSMWAGPEMAYALGRTEPTILVADAPRRALLDDPGIPVLSVEEDLPALLERYAGAALPADLDTVVDEDDPAVVLFTSGTSGRPKGATHSHRNVIAAVWFHLLNDAVATELGMAPPPRRGLLATPLFHIAALHNIAVIRLVVGDTAVLHLGKFDIDRVLRLVEAERVTNWGAVPTMASRLVEHAEQQGLDGYDLSSLRTFTVNSAPSAPTLKQRIREVLPGAARALGTTYGLTESSSAATLAGPADLAANPHTVGRPVPTMEVEVRDAENSRVPDGVEGEICLRGPLVMTGYWRDPEATAAVTTPDGFFRTGDLGTMEGGQLRISSRRSDLILRGAENVYPAEVENALDTHPDVRESIVLGVAHPDLGEEVAAVVVLRPDATTTAEELREHVQARIARYKVPTRWTLTSEALPRNATGKVMRRAVRVS